MPAVTSGRIVIGIGTRTGARFGDVEAAIDECLSAAGVQTRDVVAVVTAEARRDEAALHRLATLLAVPLHALPADLLARQPVPNPSAVTGRLIGTRSVAEAAVLAVGARLLLPKHIRHGTTVAVGQLPDGAELRITGAATGDVPRSATVQGAGPAIGPAPGAAIATAPGAGLRTGAVTGAGRSASGPEDLRHHGDAETADGLVDLAVNVRAGAPAWLRDRLRDAVDQLAAYPNPARATAAVAARHARPPEQVLLTSGAAEAFVLLARVLAPALAVVVHPQFTEPEAALIAAGHRVHRVLLPAPFRLDPDLVPAEADLVFVGNPTNPTSVLHPAADLLALARPGRVLVVDEAFMDAVPGEPGSLAGSPDRPAPDVPGLVVVRSLTKTWGLAGLRIGYLLGDARVLAACRGAQPLWSVGSIALEAAIDCSTPAALAEAAQLAATGAGDREYLLGLLHDLPGVEVAPGSRAPFVLLRVSGPDPAGVHGRLRSAGWAVRRGDTFPGLGPGWLRAAIRDRSTSAAFAAALALAVHDTAGVGPGSS